MSISSLATVYFAFTQLSRLLLLALLLNEVGLAQADNPIVQAIYTADPAAIVHNDRVWLFTGHDEDGSTGYRMFNWHLYSTADMQNWQDHGSPLSLAQFSWADSRAWAGQVINRNNKFYYYVPVHRGGGRMAIGVAVADSIEGPYTDAIGGPLVENGQIDPTVFIDDDSQAYLYWGNPDLLHVTLNDDMISYTGGIVNVTLTTAGFGVRTNTNRTTAYEEAPWLYKRNDLYYMVYAANCCAEDIHYSTGPSAIGPWTYRGLVMATAGISSTNHPAIIDFQNNSYFFYHNSALPGGGSYTRSVAVERFEYNSDGSIPTIEMSTSGPPQISTLDPYVRVEAETMAWSDGIETEICNEGGMAVSNINTGDYIKIRGVDFGLGARSLTVRVASNGTGGDIEARMGSVTGTLIGTCTVPSTGDWQSWTSVTCPISGATGIQDLIFSFTGSGSDALFNFNWWQFDHCELEPPSSR